MAAGLLPLMSMWLPDHNISKETNCHRIHKFSQRKNLWYSVPSVAKKWHSSGYFYLSNTFIFTLSRYNFSNLAWKKRRYLGSYTIFNPLMVLRRWYTRAADSAITSMCACVYTRRGIVKRTSSSLG